jgi:hypothetical protein
LARRYNHDVTKLIHSNAVDIPDVLRSLPAGAYVIESADDVLSDEEERGIAEALDAIRSGRGVDPSAVKDALSARLSK